MFFKKYSDKLNGYWEEGYYYYVEIRDDEMTLRDSGKRIVFKTSIKYDKKKLESGEKTDLIIGNKTLSSNYKGEPMWWITAFYYEDGNIIMDSHYTIMGDYHNVLKKVDHDPFYNFIILDKAYLPRLQGEWVEWRKDKNTDSTIEIKDNEIRFKYSGSVLEKQKIHVLAYRSDPKKAFINNEDLTVSGVGMYNALYVYPDMLTGYEMVCDLEVPMTVFARRDMLDKIEIPPEALREPRNTMVVDRVERIEHIGVEPLVKTKKRENITDENNDKDQQ